MSRLALSALQKQILDVLAAAGSALSTTDIRRRVNDDRRPLAVAEQIYAALMGRHRRGLVRRASGPQGQKSYWEPGIVRIRDAG